MLRRIVRLVTGGALVTLVAPAAALGQNPQCAGLSTASNARQTCDAAVDFAHAYYQLAGVAVSGGNPAIGAGGPVGRLGAFSVTLRANGFRLSVPDLSSVTADGHVAEQDNLLAPAPLLEARMGLYPGLRRGFLAVDLLAAAQLVPNEKFSSDIRVDSNAARIGPVSLGLGFGAQVGLMAEDRERPAVSLSAMRRSIPRVGFGDVAGGDEAQADVNLVAWNIRATAGKRFGLLMVAGGAGWSRYTGKANAAYNVGIGPGEQGTILVDLAQTRWMAFVDAGVDLKVVKVVGEIGRQFGVDQGLTTTFDGYNDAGGTTFYSLGLRFGS